MILFSSEKLECKISNNELTAWEKTKYLIFMIVAKRGGRRARRGRQEAGQGGGAHARARAPARRRGKADYAERLTANGRRPRRR